MNTGRTIVLLTGVLWVLLAVSGCAGMKNEVQPVILQYEEPAAMTEIKNTEIAKPNLRKIAHEYVETMSLSEQAAQVFFITLGQLESPSNEIYGITAYTEGMGDTLQTQCPGGVIYFNQNLVNREQVIQWNRQMQEKARIPLFIGVDEEGGMVNRLSGNTDMGVTNQGDMAAVGATMDTENAYQVGRELGRQMTELGFNLDFAPVADIRSNPANYEIGNRSYGETKEIVGTMVAAQVQGMKEEHLIATLKHFPGHGEVTGNTHNDLQTIPCDEARLKSFEFEPFKQGIAAGADVVMVSHLCVPTITGEDTTSSMSYEIVTRLLKHELGFEGIAMTDSCQMGSIARHIPAKDVAVQALLAGNDMILMPSNYQEAYEGIIEAVQEGTLPQERLQEACEVIICCKMKQGFMPELYEIE